MKTVTAPLAAIALFALVAQIPWAADGRANGREVTLRLPHALRDGDALWLTVTVGPTVRGQQIEITTPDGRLLGVISPYGIRSGRDAGSYTVPIPADAASDRQLSLRILLDVSDQTQRAPTIREVKKVSVTITRPSR